MSKRRYRAVYVNRIDWPEQSKRLNGQRVVLAIDVAKEAFVAVLRVGDEVVLRMKWSHPSQTPEWLSGIETLAAEADQVEAVMEPSGTYGDAIRWQLSQRGIAVYRVSPKWVHDSAETHDGVPSSHDVKAAEIIADLHQRQRSRRWEPLSETRRAALAQVTQLRQARKRFTAEKNRCGGLLSRYWPEVLPVVSLDSRTLYALLERYGSPTAIAADRLEAERLMRRIGGHFLAPATIEALLTSAEQTLGPPCIEAERQQLQAMGARLKADAEEVRQLEREIERCHGDLDIVAHWRPVVGAATATVLYAEQGDPRSYRDAHSFAKSMGLNLKEHSSGEYKGQLKITKRGPAISRYYLYFAALRLLNHPVVASWYERKTQRPGAVKMKVVVELMRKLAMGLWHVAQGEAFSAERLFHPKPPATA